MMPLDAYLKHLLRTRIGVIKRDFAQPAVKFTQADQKQESLFTTCAHCNTVFPSAKTTTCPFCHKKNEKAKTESHR